MMRPLLSSLALAAAVGCGGTKHTAPQGPSQPAAELASEAPPAARAVTLIEELSRSVTGAGEDCDIIATHIAQWTGTQRATYPELARAAAKAQIADSERESYETRLDTALTALINSLYGCQEHEGAMRAFQDFDAMIDSQ